MFKKVIIVLTVCGAIIDAKNLGRNNPSLSANKIKQEEDFRDGKIFEQNGESEKLRENRYDHSNNLENEFREFITSNLEKSRKNGIEGRKQDQEVDSDDRTVAGLLSQVFSNEQTLNHQDEYGDFEDLLKRNIEQDVKYLKGKQPEPEVGFGGNPQGDPKRIAFANLTNHVNKVINQAKQRFIQDGPNIYANIPPYVIYKIPRMPIIFKLKYIDGASTITPQGTSTGLHYFSAFYTYVQFKFQKIRYHYDVIIRPMNLFTIHKNLNVVLENTRVWMPVAVEKNTLTIQRFEFVQPSVTVECAPNKFVNYIANVIVDEHYPEFKQKLAAIAARDTKLLLDANVQDAQ